MLKLWKTCREMIFRFGSEHRPSCYFRTWNHHQNKKKIKRAWLESLFLDFKLSLKAAQIQDEKVNVLCFWELPEIPLIFRKVKSIIALLISDIFFLCCIYLHFSHNTVAFLWGLHSCIHFKFFFHWLTTLVYHVTFSCDTNT